MPTLVLLRHAKSAYPEGVDDHDRPLSPRGRRDAARAGELLSVRYSFDEVLVSTALRAQQTWQRLGEVSSGPADLRPDLYLASSGELLDLVGGLPEPAGAALLIGHNPGMEECATVLSSVPTVLKTATYAVLSSDQPWRRWRAGAADLVDLVVARG